ncbi:hypothetical protein AAEU42_01135 [Pseudoflavonifractor phocaeensis]|uniref:hypothetical protein n=1 Tax=Pseudoflavonifractor phocaeensis TaxID=1870988 RepID=UPI00313C57D6
MAYTKYEGGDEELDKILSDYGSKYQEAREAGDVSGMREANDSANQARNKYGYAAEHADEDIEYIKGKTGYYSKGSGGGSSGGGSGFSYQSAPSFVSRYQDQIDALTKRILGREAFDYDPENDPTYQQYKKTYTREGQRAMQDTLGEVAARTGGLASSYAASAAGQANDYYMGKLADKVPELRQLAYEMYQSEGDTLRSNLEMLLGLDGTDYGRYADLLGQFNTDRSFAYGAGRDQLADERYNSETAYQHGRDEVNDQRYNQEYADNRGDAQYNKDADRAAWLAAAGDYSGFAALWNLTPEQTQNLVDEYAKSKKMDEDAAARELADWYAQYGDFSKLKEQGVNTGYLSKVQGAELAGLYNKGKGGTSKTSGEPDYDGLFAAARASGHPQSFIANNYKKYGFSSSTGLYGEYQGDYEYDPGKVSAVAKGLYTDLQKYYASREDQLEKINREYQGGGISEDDYKWLLDKFGLL